MFGKLLNPKIFEPYRKFSHEDANFLHLMYLGMGGLLYDCRVSRRLKFAYIFGQIILASFLMVTTIPYICNQFRSDSWNFPLIVSAMHGLACALFYMIFDLLVFIFRHKLVHAMEMLNVDFGIEYKSKNAVIKVRPTNESGKFIVRNWIPIVEGVFAVGAITTSFLKYLCSLILLDVKQTSNNFYYWVIPVWKMENNESYAVYTFVTAIHSMSLCWACFRAFCVALFVVGSGEILCNYIYSLANILNTESSHAIVSIESINDELAANETIIQKADIRLMERRICWEFIEHCVKFLQNYRKMRRAVGDWQLFFEITFLGTFITSITYFPSAAFIVSQTDLPVPFRIAVGGYMIPPLAAFYWFCYFGQIFDDAVKFAAETVYGAPWYYFSPSERKLIHLMLCEIHQSPINFTALKIYPISLTIFPRIMNFNYTLINLMRAIQMKKLES